MYEKSLNRYMRVLSAANGYEGDVRIRSKFDLESGWKGAASGKFHQLANHNMNFILCDQDELPSSATRSSFISQQLAASLLPIAFIHY